MSLIMFAKCLTGRWKTISDLYATVTILQEFSIQMHQTTCVWQGFESVLKNQARWHSAADTLPAVTARVDLATMGQGQIQRS